jgi:hypothetical protein
VALAIAFYSALVLDFDTAGCLSALQETKLDLRNTAKPPVDRLSSRHPVQSASEKVPTRREFDLLIFSPILVHDFKYLKILFTVVQYSKVAACKN